MTIGIKYCGGCNPSYDRGLIVEWLHRDYPDILTESIRPGARYDFCIVICGCREECSDYSEIKKRYDVILVCCEKDYEKARGFVENSRGRYGY